MLKEYKALNNYKSLLNQISMNPLILKDYMQDIKVLENSLIKTQELLEYIKLVDILRTDRPTSFRINYYKNKPTKSINEDVKRLHFLKNKYKLMELNNEA